MHDVIGLAQQLANEFRANAADVDLEGRFPHENYHRMREAGYLRAAVPTELGGMGATLHEISRAQQALARGCASTALAVNMHQFQVGAAADEFRAGGPTGPLLQRVAEERIVLASTGAEFIVAGEWTTPTTARPEGEDYVIDGRKFFCSQAEGMDIVRVNARDTETGELVVVAMPVSAPGLTIKPTWDTTGMRGTASHDLLLEGVRVPRAGAVRLKGSVPTADPQATNVIRWFLLLVSGVYLGIAEEARAEAVNASGRGGNSSHRDPVLDDVMLGEMEAAFLTACAVRDTVAGELAAPSPDVDYVVARAALCKEVVTGAARTVVDRAVAIAGGKSFFRGAPLERLARDVQAARFHPPAAPVSYQIGARAVKLSESAAAVA
jgi:alkylation response protein AidB-like acyl-CoA dehydrogenase